MHCQSTLATSRSTARPSAVPKAFQYRNRAMSGRHLVTVNATAPYNFGQASTKDDIVYGCNRPGSDLSQSSPGNVPHGSDNPSEEEVKAWAEFMKSKGISRVVGLIGEAEVGSYEFGNPIEYLTSLGFKAVNVPVDEGDAVEQTAKVVAELQAAKAANEKVAIHCWGGVGRTGKQLGAYLVKEYGMTAEEAADDIHGVAKEQGCDRVVKVDGLKQVI